MKIFGIPISQKNIGEFWRRWHISLSMWLRDYLYIPLGGSRRGIVRTAINVVIVFFLGGLWHGADVKFIIWGLWIGFAISLYNLVASQLNIKTNLDRNLILRDGIGIIITFQIMAIAWVFFRANSMTQAIRIFHNFFNHDTWATSFIWSSREVSEALLLFLFLAVTHILRGAQVERPLHQIRNPIVIGIFWGILLGIMLIFHADATERFIYFQF